MSEEIIKENEIQIMDGKNPEEVKENLKDSTMRWGKNQRKWWGKWNNRCNQSSKIHIHTVHEGHKDYKCE